MIEFVDLMEGKSVSFDNENEEEYNNLWYSEQWIMEPIYFGIRYQCLIDDNNELNFLGKKKNYKQQNKMKILEQIVDELKENDLPKNTLFEGYLTFNDNKTDIYKFLKLEKINIELKNKARFYITDLLYCDGSDILNLPLFNRKKMLHKIFKETEQVKIQKSYSVDKKNIFEKFKDEFKIYLFKDLEASYSFKCSVSCKIYKIPKTYFMIVLGVIENDKDEKLKNMVVALEGAQIKNNKIIKIMNIPVHNNNSRIKLYNSKNEILGKVFEILACEKTIDVDKYQEARFVCMREDKTIDDCIFLT